MLIVDDSNIIRRRIERSVHTDTVSVVGTACNGVEAVKMFKEHSPDLVTMDLTMPEMEGNEAISAIIAIDPNVSILVISALADKLTAIDAISRGASGFLTKPFNEQELNEAIVELMEFRKK